MCIRDRRERESETDRQTDRQRQRQTETDRDRDRERQRQTDRQTDKQREHSLFFPSFSGDSHSPTFTLRPPIPLPAATTHKKIFKKSGKGSLYKQNAMSLLLSFCPSVKEIQTRERNTNISFPTRFTKGRDRIQHDIIVFFLRVRVQCLPLHIPE